jgi:hypothetical protein
MSLSLEKYDAKRARTYRESGLKAMEWAAKKPAGAEHLPQRAEVKQNLSLAQLWLYR